jgi:hypothetical protein
VLLAVFGGEIEGLLGMPTTEWPESRPRQRSTLVAGMRRDISRSPAIFKRFNEQHSIHTWQRGEGLAIVKTSLNIII